MTDLDPDRPSATPGPDDASGPDGPAGAGGGAATPAERPDPVRDTRSDDDRDLGWGDDLDRADRGDRDARWYEEQRPPHWE